MSLFSKKDFTTTNWSVLEKIFQLIAGIYIVPKVFNHLGAYQNGELEISKALIGVIAPLFFLGLSAVIIRELVFKPESKNEIIGTALVLRAISFLILFISVGTYVYLTKNTTITIIVAIIAFSYLFKICTVFEYYFVAAKQYKFVFAAKMCSLILVLTFQYYGVKHHYGVLFFAGLLVIEWCIQTIVYFAIIYKLKDLQISNFTFSNSRAKQLLKDAFPLLISNFIIVLYLSIDDFFINHFLGNQANGVFAVIDFLVIFIAWNIGAAFIYGLYPSLAQCYLVDKALYLKRFRCILIILLIYGVLIGLFFNFFSKALIYNYYDPSYFDAIYPLKIFAWSPLLIFCGMLFEKHLVNQNKLVINVYRFILGCTSSALFCYFLIPEYGLIGAAIALTLSHFITNIAFLFFYKTYRNHMLILLNLNNKSKH